MIHPCPHCHAPCMSSSQKLVVHPAGSIPCRGCGGGVSVSWRYYSRTIPALVAVLIALRSQQFEGLPLVLLGLLAASVILLLQLWLVPLSRDDTD